MILAPLPPQNIPMNLLNPIPIEYRIGVSCDVDEDLYDDYKDSDINDLLNLRNAGDLVTLQSLLRNEIKMNNVVTIT